MKRGKKPKKVALPCIELEQAGKTILLTSMPTSLLAKITYVAARRQSDEKGAVQRPLNEKRIDKIMKFAIAGGDFPVCIILNWVKPKALSHTVGVTRER